jgi:FG-GAP repeat
MRRSQILPVVLLTLVVFVVGVPAAVGRPRAGSSASKLGSGVVGDFNGDGYPDLVIGNPGYNNDDSSAAGFVEVAPGTVSGQPDISAEVMFTCSQFGFGSDGDAGCGFGRSLAVGDFNGDGYADLAIGIPGEAVFDSGQGNTGAVAVLYGGPSGLTLTGHQVWTQRSAGVAGAPEAQNRFGAALAAPDLNGDGRSELVVGVPGMDKHGAIEVLPGTSHGLTATGSRRIFRSQTGLAGSVGFGWGTRLVAGDYNGDHNGDVVVAAPGAKVNGQTRVGRVDVLYGGSHGIQAKGGATFTPATPGVGGAAKTATDFGETLTEGDYNGDGDKDLVIGSPMSNDGAGAVTVLYGSRSGLTARGSQYWTENSKGVPGKPSAIHRPTSNRLVGEQFGHAIATLNLPAATPGAAKYSALYVGVPNDIATQDDYEGTLIAFKGSRRGLTTTGIELLKDPNFNGYSTGWGIVLGGGPHIVTSQYQGPGQHGGLGQIAVLDDGGTGPYNSTIISNLQGYALTW